MDTTNALERLATITPRRYPQGSTIERRPDGCVATQRSITTSDALLTMLQVANHLRLIDHLLERMQERRGD